MEYLLTMNSSLPITLGRLFKHLDVNIPRYMTGGPGTFLTIFNLLSSKRNTLFSGYLFTRESLRRVVEIGFNQNLCSTFNILNGADDLILGNFIKIRRLIQLELSFHRFRSMPGNSERHICRRQRSRWPSSIYPLCCGQIIQWWHF
jgi:hypothetical protein